MSKHSSSWWTLLLISMIFTTGAAGAVTVEIELSTVTWQPNAGAEGDLRITGPHGFVLEHRLRGEAFSLSPYDGAGNLIADGLYRWHLAMSPTPPTSLRTRLVGDTKEGLAATASSTVEAGPTWGYFTISDGYFVVPKAEIPAEKTVHDDDTMIQGSLCVGVDCSTSETFGNDTFRLKEEVMQIHFEDTSSGGNPSNDWRITINDATDKLSIEDVDGGDTPFTLEAGAPDHALYIDDVGRIGLGTSAPVADAHIASGDTPKLRLEQDVSASQTAQTWEIASDEDSLYVTDVSNSSKVPFEIFAGAPTKSLVVDADGDVGVGILAPAGAFHVLTASTSEPTLAVFQNSASTGGRVDIELRNTQVTWQVSNAANGVFAVNAGSDAAELRVQQDGDLLIQGNLQACLDTSLSQCSVQSNFPDYVFEPDYPLMPLAELETFIERERHLPKMPTVEDVTQNGINMTQLQLQLLEKIEELTLYTLQQQETIEKLEEKVASLTGQDNP